MTRILALETSGDYASAALYDAGSVTCKIFKEKNRHTESLLSLVDGVLVESGLKLSDMDAVAFGAGPGAFTGLRVACGAAQGLAWAADLPVVQVSNLAAAANTLFALNPAIESAAIVNDARMHECYAAAFTRGEDGIPVEIRPPELIKPAMAAEYLTDTKVHAAAGSAFAAYADEIKVPESVQLCPLEAVSAQDIAVLAARMFEKGETVEPHLAAPLYVRNRVALTIKERAAGEKL